MAEQILQIENVDPKDLHGPNDKYLELVKSMFPKLKIIARGDFVKVIGDDEEIEYFTNRYETLMVQLERFGKLTAQTVEDVMMASTDSELQRKMSESDVLVFGRNGVPVKAITANQKRMVTASEQKDLIFAIGPAGTGKTYTAVALAVRALKAKEVRRIILTRPAVEADEHLGFLPGDLKDKLDPYLQPLYDALRDMIPGTKLEGYLEDHTIEIAPLAFMRGRTLDHAFVILDEAQNATRSQLKMFLTRMGRSAKFIVTGDITQIDLPPKTPSGLPQAMEVLKDVKGIEFIYLDDKDVVRHKLVTDIINAYKKHNIDEPVETRLIASLPTEQQLNDSTINNQQSTIMNALTRTDYQFPGQTKVYHGKVRDCYFINDEYMVMVATDRISAFDVILPKGIPYKGQVLNQIAAMFLDATADIVPNWKLATPDPMVTVGRLCKPFPIEMIIRGYLTGSSWRTYKSGQHTICGVQIPDGMKEHQRFAEPIITPTTKAEEGHDEDISREEIINHGLISESDYVQIEDITRKLFQRGTEIAAKQGLILVDTKYEFGKIGDQIVLMDEIHTPDSSRYFIADQYEERFAKGEPQVQLSKEFVREWLMANGFQGKEGQQVPEMTPEYVNSVSERYIELYEKVTGHKFEKAPDSEDLVKRIETNVLNYLKL